MGYVIRIAALSALAACALLGATAAPASAQLGLPCGLLTPCPPDPEPPPAPPPAQFDGASYTIDAKASADDVTEKERVAFRGSALRNGAPTSVPVELVAVTWPYKVERVVGGDVTGESFEIEHKPGLNTRYYLRTGDLDPGPGVVIARSRVFRILVLARLVDFDLEVPRDYVVAMSFKVDFPDDYKFPVGNRPVHWYIVPTKRKRKPIKLGVTRTKGKGDNVFTAKIRRRVSRARGNFRFYGSFCIDLNRVRDDGVGRPSKARCP